MKGDNIYRKTTDLYPWNQSHVKFSSMSYTAALWATFTNTIYYVTISMASEKMLIRNAAYWNHQGHCQVLSKGRQVDIILLDFPKAFNKVPYARLLLKLDFYSVRGNTNKWISSFLGGQKQLELLENCHSTCAEVLSEVPKETVLDPLLILAYINDLPDVTKSSDILLMTRSSSDLLLTNMIVTYCKIS